MLACGQHRVGGAWAGIHPRQQLCRRKQQRHGEQRAHGKQAQRRLRERPHGLPPIPARQIVNGDPGEAAQRQAEHEQPDEQIRGQPCLAALPAGHDQQRGAGAGGDQAGVAQSPRRLCRARSSRLLREQRLPLGRRCIRDGGVLAALQGAQVADDRPAIGRPDPIGKRVHHPVTAGDHIEQMRVRCPRARRHCRGSPAPGSRGARPCRRRRR